MSRVSGPCMSMLALSASVAGVAHAQVADRYGPAAPSYDVPAVATDRDVLAGAPVRMLSWPGKVVSSPAAIVTADAPAPGLRQARSFVPVTTSAPPKGWRRGQAASASVAPSATAYRAIRYVQPAAEPPPASSAASARYGLVQAFPQANSSASLAGAPSAPSIYDEAPAQSAPRIQASFTPAANPALARQPTPAQAAAASDALHPGWAPPRRSWSQAGDQGVRFYSLHRQYGVTPDPAPIPPQFFAATADLGEPAGPTSRTVSGAGTAAQAARAMQAAESDTAASQP